MVDGLIIVFEESWRIFFLSFIAWAGAEAQGRKKVKAGGVQRGHRNTATLITEELYQPSLSSFFSSFIMVSHGRKLAKLSREVPHRMAMLRNMVTSLIKHERIQTTHAKAKAAQRMFEQMVAYAKDARAGSVHAHRKIQAFVRERGATQKLSSIIADRYKFRPCGFSRVVHFKNRLGDNASLSVLELVDRKGELRPAADCSRDYFLSHQIIARLREGQQKTYRI